MKSTRLKSFDTTGTRLGRVVLIVAIVAAGGCRAPMRPDTPDRYPDGIITPVSAGPDGCMGCLDLYRQPVAPDARVQDLVIGSIMSMRDFKPPAGPDGYVLSIAPIDSDSRSRPVAGARMTLCLYRHPRADRPLDPSLLLRTWQLEPHELSRYWAKTRLLDCYMLFLDWREPIRPSGNLLFVVTLEYPQGRTTGRVCRHLSLSGSEDFRLSQP